jgi:hypothetical protein
MDEFIGSPASHLTYRALSTFVIGFEGVVAMFLNVSTEIGENTVMGVVDRPTQLVACLP